MVYISRRIQIKTSKSASIVSSRWNELKLDKCLCLTGWEGRMGGSENDGDEWRCRAEWLGRGHVPASSSITPSSPSGVKRDQTTALRCGPRTLVPKYIRCSQLPEGSTVMQVMENPGFSLKSTFDIWLNSSSTSWAINTILAFLCTLGLFFLTLH